MTVSKRVRKVCDRGLLATCDKEALRNHVTTLLLLSTEVGFRLRLEGLYHRYQLAVQGNLSVQLRGGRRLQRIREDDAVHALRPDAQQRKRGRCDINQA